MNKSSTGTAHSPVERGLRGEVLVAAIDIKTIVILCRHPERLPAVRQALRVSTLRLKELENKYVR